MANTKKLMLHCFKNGTSDLTLSVEDKAFKEAAHENEGYHKPWQGHGGDAHS